MAKSKFLKVKSPDSDYTVVIFDKCDTVIKDPVTGSTIALPTGGKAKILGEIFVRINASTNCCATLWQFHHSFIS